MLPSSPSLVRSAATAAALPPVFVVEDDDSALVLIRRLLLKSSVRNRIDVALDGEEALTYLQRCADGEAPLPLFVLLDLKLPRINGFEILEWKRTQPSLERLHTVVVSSSCERSDAEKALALGAAAYLEKYPSISDIVRLHQTATALAANARGQEPPTATADGPLLSADTNERTEA